MRHAIYGRRDSPRPLKGSRKSRSAGGRIREVGAYASLADAPFVSAAGLLQRPSIVRRAMRAAEPNVAWGGERRGSDSSCGEGRQAARPPNSRFRPAAPHRPAAVPLYRANYGVQPCSCVASTQQGNCAAVPSPGVVTARSPGATARGVGRMHGRLRASLHERRPDPDSRPVVVGARNPGP